MFKFKSPMLSALQQRQSAKPVTTLPAEPGAAINPGDGKPGFLSMGQPSPQNPFAGYQVGQSRGMGMAPQVGRFNPDQQAVTYKRRNRRFLGVGF